MNLYISYSNYYFVTKQKKYKHLKLWKWNLIEKYKDTLECKRSDTNTIKKKSATWEKVCLEFNSKCGGSYRNSKVLKNKYENLKKRAKSNFAKEKQPFYKTGGGPYEKTIITNVDSRVKDLIGVQLTGNTSTYDNDAASTVNINPINQDNNVIHINSINDGNIEIDKIMQVDEMNHTGVGESEELSDWSRHVPEMLKTPVSTPLRSSRSSVITNCNKRKRDELNLKLTKWCDEKQALAKQQLQCLLEEHNLKLQHMREAHEKKMAAFDEEQKLKLRHMENEHQAKMAHYKHMT